MRLCFAKGITNSAILFDFSPPLAKHLINSYVTQFPIKILKLDDRNQSVYRLAKKLSLHYSIRNNVDIDTNSIISVKSLLTYCEDTIPSYETVRNKDGSTKRCIVEPFIRSMNVLKDEQIIKWRFCKAKKQAPFVATDAIPYHELINLYVQFRILGLDPINR
jgi:hypothetical protein